MKAVVDGVAIEGTPEEIAALLKVRAERASLADRVNQPPARLGPRKLTPDEQREHDRIVKLLDGLKARTQNFNITPLAHSCPGGMRFC